MDDDLLGLIEKYNIPYVSSKFIKSVSFLFDNCIKEGGSHSSIGDICKTMFKDVIVYDENTNLWFYCNVKNIWKKSKSPFILIGLIKLLLVIYLKYMLEN